MDLVATRLRNDVHHQAGGFGLTESTGRRERDFLRVADISNVGRRLSAAWRVADVQAIHPHPALVRAPAMNRKLRRHRACGRVVDVGEHARDHRHHRSVIALVGDRPDDVVIDRHLAPCALHVDDRRRAGHGDGLRQRADFHLGVHRGGERSRQLDAFTPIRAEPAERERHGVGSWPEILDTVLAGAVGDGAADLFNQRRAGGLDGHAGQDGSRRVFHDARDHGLRKRGTWKEDEQRNNGNLQDQAHVSVTSRLDRSPPARGYSANVNSVSTGACWVNAAGPKR